MYVCMYCNGQEGCHMLPALLISPPLLSCFLSVARTSLSPKNMYSQLNKAKRKLNSISFCL